MSLLVQSRDDAKHEIIETEIIDLCINLIDKYPEEDVDHEILCLSLTLIS